MAPGLRAATRVRLLADPPCLSAGWRKSKPGKEYSELSTAPVDNLVENGGKAAWNPRQYWVVIRLTRFETTAVSDCY